MLERIATNSTQLDFAERPMTSVTEMYKSEDIRTGETMSEYTWTQTTSQRICFDSAQKAQAQRKRNEELRELYSSTPQGFKEHFSNMQKKYSSHVDNYITELMEWEVTILATRMHNPTRTDFDDKIKELCEDFKKKHKEFPIENYFANGPDDDMFAGAFLATLARNNNSKVIAKAVQNLSGIQWLIRERDKLPIEDTKPMPEKDAIDMSLLTQQKIEEEENRKSEELQEESAADDDELLAMLKHFNIGAKAHKITVNGKSIPCKIVETSLMYMYQAEGKVWADTPESMSKKIIDVLPETKECSSSKKKTLFSTIAVRIRRCAKESGNFHPDQMTIEKIKEKTGCKTSEATTILNNWDGVLNAIVQNRDTILKKQTDKLTTTYKTDNNLQN